MYIEMISVCVNYSDFLVHTLPRNKKQVDDIIIVTTDKDLDTQKVCNDNGVKFITTDRFYEGGAQFNKGKGINAGFPALNRSDWILHFDADMLLPDDFAEKIRTKDLDVESIYGTGRYLCPSYESWMKYVRTGRRRPRWRYQGRTVSVAMGFFQLFNAKSKALTNEIGPWYPEGFGHAGRSDRLFMRKWGANWKKIEDIIPVHIESEQCALGVNWRGRKTPPFGPNAAPSLPAQP